MSAELLRSLKSTRYWLFAGQDYESMGGLRDVVFATNSREDMVQFISTYESEYGSPWAHMFDSEEGTLYPYYIPSQILDDPRWTTVRSGTLVVYDGSRGVSHYDR